jgi:MEDS: MEthanogen/methylotroph, DcmR Sensory domain
VKTTPSMRLAGGELGENRHVCAFFNSEDEEYRVLLPFIKEGFERGDKAVHVVNPDQPGSHRRRLTAAGIDVESAEQNGQLELRTNSEVYLRDGHFDQEWMLQYSSNSPVATSKDPYNLAKSGGEMVVDIMRTHPMDYVAG